MPQPLTVNEFEFQRLDAAARESLIDTLTALQLQIFEGIDRDRIAGYLRLPFAVRTWVQLFQTVEGASAGYSVIHLCKVVVTGRTRTVFRIQAGMLREFRGRNVAMDGFVRKGLQHKLRHPTADMYYFGYMVHPSSHYLFAKYMSVVWPSHERPTPPRMIRLMRDMSAAWGAPLDAAEPPLVYRAGRITSDDAREREYWHESRKPSIRFFLESNPRYEDGFGLVTLIPLSPLNVIRSLGRWLAGRIRRRAGAAIAKTQGPAPRPHRLSRWSVQRALRAPPLLAGLERGQLGALIDSAALVLVSEGTFLLRQGDRGDSLFVVIHGVAHIVLEEHGEERVLDELGRGDVVGEMSLLSGAPRSASVRAGTALQVMRIDRTNFDRLMTSNPGIATTVWSTYALRALANCLRVTPLDHQLDEGARTRWLEAGRRLDLAPGTMVDDTDGSFFLLLRGSATVVTDGGSRRVDATALVELAGRTVLRPITPIEGFALDAPDEPAVRPTHTS